MNKNEIKDLVMQEIESMMDEKKRRKQARNLARNPVCAIGLVAKEPKAAKAAGLIVTHQTEKVATKPVVVRKARSDPSIQPVVQPPEPVKSAAKASLGVRKQQRKKV